MSISNDEDSESVGGSVDDAILDAARTCVEEFGVKRTTLAEVARRAGVSRPTVYRRWPDTRTLIGQLLTRELRTTAPSPTTGDDARECMFLPTVGMFTVA